MKKIIFGAQSWAWGPASKAEVIARYLKNDYNVFFCGTGTSYNFCKLSGTFTDCYELANEDDYSEIDFSQFECAISIMDPFFALWANKYNVKLYWVDSMSWLWDWKMIEEIKFSYNELKDKEILAAFTIMKNMPPRSSKIVGQLLSDKVFVQGNYFKESGQLQTTNYVSAIIDNSHITNNRKRNSVLISLSGQLCPVIDDNLAIQYTNIVLTMLQEFIEICNTKYRVVVAGNSQVLEQIDKLENVEYLTFAHKDFLIELNSTKAILCPCGFTTVYEAAAYKVPIMFLPENHEGHAYEYNLITKEANDTERETIFPNLFLDASDKDVKNLISSEDIMERLQACYCSILNSPDSLKRYQQKALEFIKLFEDSDITEKQHELISKNIGGFTGVKEICDMIIEDL